MLSRLGMALKNVEELSDDDRPQMTTPQRSTASNAAVTPPAPKKAAQPKLPPAKAKAKAKKAKPSSGKNKKASTEKKDDEGAEEQLEDDAPSKTKPMKRPASAAAMKKPAASAEPSQKRTRTSRAYLADEPIKGVTRSFYKATGVHGIVIKTDKGQHELVRVRWLQTSYFFFTARNEQMQ